MTKSTRLSMPAQLQFHVPKRGSLGTRLMCRYMFENCFHSTFPGLHVHSGLTRTQSPWHFTKHSTSEINHILKPLKHSALTKQPSIHPFWYLEVHYILLLHHAMQGLHSTLTSTQLPWHFTTSVRQNLIQTTSYN